MNCIKFSYFTRSTLIIIIIVFINSISCCDEDNLTTEDDNKTIINTNLQIIGTILKNHQGKEYFAFRGIPYAKPPINDRRFKDPEPYGKWNGLFDGTKDGNICPQIIKKTNENPNLKISEDCLNLNVYTKSLKANQSVIVYIYGGGFKYGNGNSEIYQPKYLLDKDIVLVTFNYRLGAFGFLSSGTKDATGNYALKDQVLVLKWINDNIHNFGGNPNSVTLIGHSVGAISVSLHMISPMSTNLFHKVIMLSGSGTLHSNPNNTNIKWTNTLAKLVECSTDHSSKEMIECLRNKTWQQIIKASTSWELYGLASLQWNYEIEMDFGQERFIIENPIDLFKNGKFNKVPIIIGLTKDEFAGEGHKVILNTELINNLNSDFNQLAPQLFFYDNSPINQSIQISNRLKEFYFKNQKIGILTENELGNIFSDALINHAVHRFVQLVSQYTDVYYYRLDYKGNYSCSLLNSYGEPYYVGHSDHLIYLFVLNKCAPEFNNTDSDYLMVKRYMKYFINLAKFGNPNFNIIENDIKCTNNWEPSIKGNIKTLYIDENCRMDESPIQDRFALWDELFPIE